LEGYDPRRRAVSLCSLAQRHVGGGERRVPGARMGALGREEPQCLTVDDGEHIRPQHIAGAREDGFGSIARIAQDESRVAAMRVRREGDDLEEIGAQRLTRAVSGPGYS
jgi:hypothetical protein